MTSNEASPKLDRVTLRLLPPIRALRLAAAVLVCAASATAARPRSAELPEASRACDRYGPGYRLVAGTDTCLRVGGTVRLEVGATLGGSDREVGSYLGRPRR